jgi:hypothetical protein
VATIIDLNSVTPRSIAYITVQVLTTFCRFLLSADCHAKVRFAMSSLNTWNETDIDFNYRDFYYAIIDYFEVTPGPVAQQHTSELLHWWNK